MATGKFTPKQATFVLEYLIDLNATQAAIRAGYSAKTANEQGARLLANVSIQAAIQQAMNERKKRIEVNADYVLQSIVETVERCKQATPVYKRDTTHLTVDADGQVIAQDEVVEGAEYQFNPTAVLKGCEMLGKHLSMFTDKVEVNDKTEHSGADRVAARLAQAIALATIGDSKE
jgi:phage terminase small subunit